jgi:hypothetical protein
MTATAPPLLDDPGDLSALRTKGAGPDELFASFAAWAEANGTVLNPAQEMPHRRGISAHSQFGDFRGRDVLHHIAVGRGRGEPRPSRADQRTARGSDRDTTARLADEQLDAQSALQIRDVL